jgi:hypothetical protein
MMISLIIVPETAPAPLPNLGSSLAFPFAFLDEWFLIMMDIFYRPHDILFPHL